MGKWGKGWQTGHKIDRKLRRKTIDVTARTKAIGVTKMAAATTTAAPRSAGVPVKPSTGTAWNNAPMSGAIRNAGRANGASWSGGMPNVVILTISLMRDGRHEENECWYSKAYFFHKFAQFFGNLRPQQADCVN